MRNCLLLVFVIVSNPVFAEDRVRISDIPFIEVYDKSPSQRKTLLLNSNSVFKMDKTQRKIINHYKAETLSSVDKSIENNVVVLRGLNKVMGRVSTLEATLGTVTYFENLEIIARKCWKSSPKDRLENSSLLEIREVKVGEAPKQVFLGWMFSSSPSISGLEHPVYDITVLSCEFRKNLETR